MEGGKLLYQSEIRKKVFFGLGRLYKYAKASLIGIFMASRGELGLF
jgi:hypothetical protein